MQRDLKAAAEAFVDLVIPDRHIRVTTWLRAFV